MLLRWSRGAHRPDVELESGEKRGFRETHIDIHSRFPGPRSGTELQRRDLLALYDSGPGSPAFPDCVDGKTAAVGSANTEPGPSSHLHPRVTGTGPQMEQN